MVAEIRRRLGDTFLCDRPHQLSFKIGGRIFPVDPRDLVSQAFDDSVSLCMANIVETDIPILSDQGGYLYSWSLGTPFLKR